MMRSIFLSNPTASQTQQSWKNREPAREPPISLFSQKEEKEYTED
jgi:hypothetical protein